jgi:hypothetical protein
MVSACPQSFTPSSSIPTAVHGILYPQQEPPKRERFAMTPLGALQALGASCTRAEILTYTALELHANKDTGFCCPGRETLASITGLPENRITKATSSLEKKGFIRKEQPDPFHVHYYLLTPPVVEPVEPRARFRPPLKVQPVEVARPVPPAEPAPAPETSATNGMNQCHQRNELVPPAAPLTDQWTENSKEREPTAEPARPEPAAAGVPPLSDFATQATQNPEPEPQPIPKKGGRDKEFSPLRNTKTAVPDTIPEVWLEQAGLQRPDLTAETIRKSAGIFIDNHRAKGTMLVDWSAAFRVWIARERAPKAPQNAQQATQPISRYAHLDAKEQPVSAAVKAALERSEQDRISLLIANGIDPATGLKTGSPASVTQTVPKLPATPITPGRSFDPTVETRPMTEAEECARFEELRKIALEKLAALQAKAAQTPPPPISDDVSHLTTEQRWQRLVEREAARKAARNAIADDD